MRFFARLSRQKRSSAEGEAVYTCPLDVLYRASDAVSVPFRVPVSWCIDALGFSFADGDLTEEDSVHPYTRAIRQLARRESETYATSLLKDYYEQFQPATTGRLFPEAGSNPVAVLPPNTHFTPWFEGTVDDRMARTRRALQREFPGVSDPGNPLFGPISDQQGDIEFARLVEVYRSIGERGYTIPRDRRSHIQGLVLRRNEEFRFLVTAGKHRVAALVVLGESEIPVVFRRPVIIESRDAVAWPFVRPDGWGLEAALAYFDRIFQGKSAASISLGKPGR